MNISKSAAVAVFLTCGILAWLGGTADRWWQSYTFKGQQLDYYNLLVDGFLEGQLAMKAEVHPDRYSPDPDIRRNAPYMLDAALYEGKYYLYYGVVPAALVMLPYSWLTGHDLSPNVVVLLFCLIGYLVSVRLYGSAKKIYFPNGKSIIDVCACVFFGLGSMLPLLVRRSAFYELPIAAGYACIIVAIFGLFRVYHGQGRALFWLSVASLFVGLAVGCRPNYVFALPMVALAAFWLWRKSPGQHSASNIKRLAIAAVLPAAIVGVFLAAYNYGRFGDPLNFGFKYGMNAFFDTGKPLTSLTFILPNLIWYYLTPPVISIHFPFFQPINAADLPPLYYSDEAIHGQFLVFCLAMVVAVAALFLLHRKRPGISPFTLFLASLAWIGVTNLVFMVIIGVRANRYMIDFQAPFVLVLGLLGAVVATRLSQGWFRRLWISLFCSFGLLASAANIFNGIELFDGFKNTRPNTFATLSYYANYPSHWAHQAGLIKYGPIKFTVKFPRFEDVGNVQAPLLVTGTPGKTDILYAHQVSDSAAILMLLHSGYGGPNSKIHEFDPSQDQTFEVDLGSLYPPIHHPYYDGWDPTDIKRLKTLARVNFNGETVLHTLLKTYDSPPHWIYFGRNPAGVDKAFVGEITSVTRLAPRTKEDLSALSEPGWWRLRITFPESVRRAGQPVLGSGVSGEGNLLFVEILDKNEIRFGLDQWGGGASMSPPITINTSDEHQLEVFIGPQVSKRGVPASWGIAPEKLAEVSLLLNVWLDGRLVWSTRAIDNLDSYDVINLGQNLQGFSTAGRDFGGSLESIPYSEDEQREFVERNLMPPEPQTEFEIIDGNPVKEGILRAEIAFSAGQSGSGQPIYASGIVGAGNMLYAEITGENKVRLGFDEWGVGARYSRILDVDFQQQHILEIFAGPLATEQVFPDDWEVRSAEKRATANLLNVWLDGELVWSIPIKAHLNSYSQAVYLGRNPQGFSTTTTRYGNHLKLVPLEEEQRRAFVLKNMRRP